jgi:hypothetical protein
MSVVGSQLSTVPKGLPLLPGNGFKDPTVKDFKKSHVFDVHQGISIAHDSTVMPPPPTSEVEPPMMPPMPTADITPVQPAWVAFDRKVLRFNCYFKEAVNESRLENFRIRNCVLYYYLEDDSMHVSEPKVENSGIPQGERKGTVFLKRHRVPKPDGGFYGVADLNVGTVRSLPLAPCRQRALFACPAQTRRAAGRLRSAPTSCALASRHVAVLRAL